MDLPALWTILFLHGNGLKCGLWHQLNNPPLANAGALRDGDVILVPRQIHDDDDGDTDGDGDGDGDDDGSGGGGGDGGDSGGGDCGNDSDE